MQSAYPNRFFGANPVAVPNQGRKEGGCDTDLPRTWRAALGLDEAAAGDGAAGAAQSTGWSGEQPES